MIASRTTPLTAARTKIDWSASGCIFSSGGSVWPQSAAACRGCRLTTSSVEALPAFRTIISDAARAVLPHDVGLRREAVAHLRHIAQVDRGVPLTS